MVEGDGHVPELADDELPVANRGPRRDPVEAEDPDLRMVDERGDDEAAEPARAGDGERGATELLRRQGAGARRVGQAGHVLRELVDGAAVAAAHDGDDEALLRLDGDAEVVAVEQHDLVALEAGVELGHLLQRQRGRAQGERDEAGQVEPGEVALLHVGDSRDLPVRAREVLGDHAAHASKRDARSLGAGRSLWL